MTDIAEDFDTYQWPELPSGRTIDSGPYIESWGEGPGIWLPCHLWSWPKARHEASMMAREIGGGNDVAIYVGKQPCQLDLEEGGPYVEGVPCYVFEAQER